MTNLAMNLVDEKETMTNTNTKYSLEDRPSFDEYFLFMAHAAALRSDDLFVKCGAIITYDNRIVGTGYNGTVTGTYVPGINPEDRDYRRQFMLHAEHNAILNCSLNPNYHKGVYTIYVTGVPCDKCLMDINQFGINHIVCCQDQHINNMMNYSENRHLIPNHATIDVYLDDNKWVQAGKELLEKNN